MYLGLFFLLRRMHSFLVVLLWKPWCSKSSNHFFYSALSSCAFLTSLSSSLTTVFMKCWICTQEGGAALPCLFWHSHDSWLSVIFQTSFVSKSTIEYSSYSYLRSGKGCFSMTEVAIADSLLKLPSLGHYLRWNGLGFVHWLGYFLFSKIPNVELKCDMLEWHDWTIVL